MENNQPKLNLADSRAEKIISLIMLSLVLSHILMIFYYLGDLPDKIPGHFGIDGKPDRWDVKNSIWLLPTISVLIALLLNYIRTIPHKYNFPKKITPENAATEYQKAKWGIALLNLGIALLFILASWKSIQIGLGKETSLGWGFNLLLLAVIIIPIAVMLKPSN